MLPKSSIFPFPRNHSNRGGKLSARVRARVSSDEHFLHIGDRLGWGDHTPFGLTLRDRSQHLYCIGQSGTGKSTLLLNLLIQDIRAGRGFSLIDVHGDLAQELLTYIPGDRFDDVVYFDPADFDSPIGLNPFFAVEPKRRHVVASNVVGAFKGIWRESWGVRMEYVLYAAIASLLECQGTTLLAVTRLFTDAAYRRKIVKQLKDPMLRGFWLNEFEQWNSRLRQEIILPIQNKIGALLMTPMMRNVLGQVRRKVDFRFMMDDSRIFIANLNKGALGEDKAKLLGSLIISDMQCAALGRADADAADRSQFCLYVDEFQNFQTGSFGTILSEARKYGLSLVLSHQFANQLEEDIADAVFGNVATIISFRVGFKDAERLSAEFGRVFPSSHFSALPNHQVCVKILTKGQIMEPFQGGTLPPFGCRIGRQRKLIVRSREKYGVRRAVVEEKHRKWFLS